MVGSPSKILALSPLAGKLHWRENLANFFSVKFVVTGIQSFFLLVSWAVLTLDYGSSMLHTVEPYYYSPSPYQDDIISSPLVWSEQRPVSHFSFRWVAPLGIGFAWFMHRIR